MLLKLVSGIYQQTKYYLFKGELKNLLFYLGLKPFLLLSW